mmetsp:Transcript_14719/g.23007  ORF Transcript_14719/g.23007 Transcript_14719/m.23007 type:complete len:283 (-) Transcript_14719:268-1116(-)
MTVQTFQMEDTSSNPSAGRKGFFSRKNQNRGGRRRGKKSNSNKKERDDSSSLLGDDGNSLTYSAASSMDGSSALGSISQSSCSQSSFSDIMRVIDLEDRDEMAGKIKKEFKSSKKSGTGRLKAFLSSEKSTTSSLNYSTDGETSALNGESLLQITMGDNAWGDASLASEELFEADSDVMFTPAQPVEKKRTRSRTGPKSPNSSKTPKTKNSNGWSRDQTPSTSGSSRSSATAEPRSPPLSPHPPKPKRLVMEEDGENGNNVFYTKWWMCGFADACTDTMPKW